MGKIQIQLKKHWLDFGLLAVALVAFGGFVYGTLIYQEDGLGGPVGRLTWGQAQRKRSGMVDFQTVVPEVDLFNNDMVWTGGTEGARIKLDGGATLKIPSDTLLVLRRFSNTGWAESIDILKGEAILELQSKEPKKLVASTEKEKKETENRSPPTPSASPSNSPSAAPSPSLSPSPTPSLQASPEPDSSYTPRPVGYLYPSHGMIFMNINPKRDHVDIVFSWNEAVTGELTLARQGESATLSRVGVKSTERSVSVSVPVKSGTYVWQIDASGKTLGPNLFKIEPYDEARLHNVIQKDPNQVVEFLP
jgi:hypothetical protein